MLRLAKKIVIVATLDTKGQEVEFVLELIEKRGHTPVTVDCGILGEPPFKPFVSREEVARAAGTAIEEILATRDKNHPIRTMARGAALVASQLYRDGQLDGIISMGGIQGTVIGTTVMHALPFGVPKVMISAVANGQTTFGPFVGIRDVTILHSVADILGLNAVTRRVLAEGVGAIVGMVEMDYGITVSAKPTVALTSAGVTTPCANRARELLEGLGYEVVAFHCNGIGAKAMEELADEGKIHGIFDLSPHDISDYLFGGIMPADPGRMKTTCRRGVPQVIAPGCADIILYGPVETAPIEMLMRKYVIHNPIHTHVKANYGEMLAVGRFIGTRLRDHQGSALVLVPARGFSQRNVAGGPLFEPESDRGFLEGVKQALEGISSGRVRAEALDLHINDPAFAEAAVRELHAMIQEG
jgi:uncharacterized protein (UPF0261 family)